MKQSHSYKLSYVVRGDKNIKGSIINVDKAPKVGETVKYNGRLFQILEITELIAPVDDFGFLHATCQYLGDSR